MAVNVCRRKFLSTAGAGFASVALSALTGKNLIAGSASGNAVAGKIPHHFGRAKNVIFLFMEGGPSHLDLFDPKPLLRKLAGQTLPGSFETPVTAAGEVNSPLLADQRKWAQHGESGLWISDWLPHHSRIADELCVIRSCVTDGINHAGGVCQMNTGAIFAGRPSLGSWVSYGLGSESRNLPDFVVIKDSNSMVVNGVNAWGSGFIPSTHQGVLLETSGAPISNLENPDEVPDAVQQQKLEFLADMNRGHLATRSSHSDLEARIRSYELAFRMQAHAPEAINLGEESKATKSLYGLDRDETKAYGKNCLLARRLVERGVRFIQLYHGAGSKWDAHTGIEANHARLCRSMDQPVTGLITDLKQRGLLDETLVIWGGEFGRTPMSEKGSGRDHNTTGFTMWMAGGGVRGGQTVGATDDLGLYATEDKLHVHDLHATIMALMGLDHTKVIYPHKGRPERVDLNEGHVHRGIVSGA